MAPATGPAPRTVTDIHRHHGVIVLTDQVRHHLDLPTTDVIPTDVIPTAVPDPLHIHISAAANGGTR